MKMAQQVTADNKSLVKAATPFKVFGPKQTEWIQLLDDGVLQGMRDQWSSIGIDHVIDPTKTTSIEIMAIHRRSCDDGLYFSVGFGSRGAINTPGINNISHFMTGWDYHCHGLATSEQKHIASSFPVALNQAFKLEIKEFKTNLYLKGHEIASYDVKGILEKHKDEGFYFCVSMAGRNMKIKIIDFKAAV